MPRAADNDPPISARRRAELERCGAVPLAHGGHDFRHVGTLQSVWCACGAGIGWSNSWGPEVGVYREAGADGWGRCPLAGGP